MSAPAVSLALELTTPFGPGKLEIVSMHGEEKVSGLFHYTLELSSAESALDFSTIVGKPVTIAIVGQDGSKDYVSGIVGRFSQTGFDPRQTNYYADVYPWLWLLTMNSDCQIFQNKTAPEIIKQVFSDLGFTDFTDSLTATYKPREFCVQYMETSFEFVSRLMEEEGIFYFFTHTSSGHKLVLADDSSAWEAIPGYAKLAMRGTTFEGNTHEGWIYECALDEQITVGQFKTDDYDFENPALELLATATTDRSARAIYEFPGRNLKKDAADSAASRVLASYEVGRKTMRGSGGCRAMHAGRKFKLNKHPRSDANDDYYVRSISLQVSQTS
jgi:type VI secretion system secreted protein VgrG